MTPTLLALLASMTLSGSLLLILSGVVALRRSASLKARFEVLDAEPMSVEEYEMSLPFSQRFLMPVLRRVGAIIARRTPTERINQTRRQLVLAGNPGNLSVPEFMAIRIVASGFLGGVVPFLLFMRGYGPTHVVAAVLLGGAMGYFYPTQYLKQKIKARQKSIERALPDSIDLITISVEAGLGFDLALKRVTDKWDNALSDELQKVLTDMRLGRPRREALKDMVERTGVDDLATFVSSIVQAEQLGVGIVQVLRVQAEQLRLRRRQRAQELAQKAPIKIIIPMVMFIFPSLYVVLLGPAVPQMMATLGGG